MQLELINDTVFLKTNDTATQVHLRVSDDLGEPFDLTSMSKVVVVIGVEQGRIIELPTKLLAGVGELEFGLDNGDLVPSGDLRLEVHIYTPEGEMHNAPSKGYYKLKMQKPIDELGVEVTTYTLDYFLDQVNKATAGIPAMIEEGQQLIDDLNVSKGEIDGIKQSAHEALDEAAAANILAGTTLTKANEALTKSETALSNADTAIARANAAADNADNKATLAQNAATAANTATGAANAAAQEANTMASFAEDMGQEAQGAAIRADNAAAAVAGWGTTTNWNSTTAYVKNNVVAYNGSTWQAVVANTNSMPDKTNAKWILLAQRGIDGEGAVSSVNNKAPEENGNVVLTPDDIGTYSKTAIDDKVQAVKTAVDLHIDDLLSHGGEYDLSLTNKVAGKPIFKNATRLSHGTSNGLYSELKESDLGSGVYDILEVKVGDGTTFTSTATYKLTYANNAVIAVALVTTP